MNSLETLRQSLEFDTWANGLILHHLQSSSNPDQSAIQKFGHVVLGEKFWLLRIKGETAKTQTSDFWSCETVADCESIYNETRDAYKSFFADLTEEKLESTFTYTNSEGNTYTNSLREVFTHVFFHSVHHRGQIIEAIRNSGEKPPYVDFIGFLRT